jgi:hypothetical protein
MVSPISEVPLKKTGTKSRLRSKSPKRSKVKKSVARAPRKAGRITKHDRVLGLLRAKSGSTIAAIAKVTGWQPHSVRAFLTGVVKKKLGLTVSSEKTKSGRIYRIIGARLGIPTIATTHSDGPRPPVPNDRDQQ